MNILGDAESFWEQLECFHQVLSTVYAGAPANPTPVPRNESEETLARYRQITDTIRMYLEYLEEFIDGYPGAYRSDDLERWDREKLEENDG